MPRFSDSLCIIYKERRMKGEKERDKGRSREKRKQGKLPFGNRRVGNTLSSVIPFSSY